MAENPARGEKEHLVRIDVLRGVAIVLVFLLHWFGQAFGTDHLEWSGLIRDPHAAPIGSFWLFYPLSFGWMGVPLFFVISGFCIHASALRHGSLAVGNFFWRRFWRIYPPYVVALLFSLLMVGINVRSPDGRAQLISHLLLLHNWNAQQIFALNGVFWSLAVEVQLYLLYPVLWRLRGACGIGGALAFTSGLSVIGRLVCATFFTDWSKDLSGTIWTSPLLLWFDWTLGAFVAERYLSGRRAFPKRTGFIWVALIIVILSTWTKPTATFTFSLASVFFAIVCDAYLHAGRSPHRLARLLVPVGLCSYSFYLVHYPLVGMMAGWCRQIFGSDRPVVLMAAMPIVFLLILGLSVVAYRTIEHGSIRLGQLLWRVRLTTR